jgi:hypothetical protein
VAAAVAELSLRAEKGVSTRVRARGNEEAHPVGTADSPVTSSVGFTNRLGLGSAGATTGSESADSAVLPFVILACVTARSPTARSGAEG